MRGTSASVLTGIVDTHSHILPGVDDGARNMKETVTVVSAAADAGIRHMCATPHMWSTESFLSPDEMASVIERTNRALEDEGVPVTVYPGAEVLCSEELLTCDRALLEAATLGNGGGGGVGNGDGGRYILLEFPFSHIPECAARVVHRLGELDLIPLLAHMERNREIQSNVGLARTFVDSGCLIQMDAASLTGDLGGGSMRSSWELLGEDLVFCIASDVHFLDARITSFDRAVGAVSARLGEQAANRLFIDSPGLVIS